MIAAPLVLVVVAFLLAFLAAARFTARLGPLLARWGAIAAPGPDGIGRPLPRGAGLAIVAVTATAGLVAIWLVPPSWPAVLGWLLPAAAVAAVSLRDDFAPLPAMLRLGVHVAAAILLVAAAGPIRGVSLGGLEIPDLGPAAWPLTVLWIVGLTNAFNFMDGIDGIAGITAAAAGAVLAVAAGTAGWQPAAIPALIVPLALAAGALGFLTGNWPPARVFMGDVGSTFCGFTVAALPLVGPPAARSALLEVAWLAMWPFIFDAGITLLRRLGRRENVLEAHRGHLYQRLAIAGWSHRGVAALYGLLAAGGGGIAAAGIAVPPLAASAEVVAAAAAVFVPVLLLTLVQVSEARANQLPVAAGGA